MARKRVRSTMCLCAYTQTQRTFYLRYSCGVYCSICQSSTESISTRRNPFDVTGALSTGMRAIWVDRAGRGWSDRLLDPATMRPTKIVRSLYEIPNLMESL